MVISEASSSRGRSDLDVILPNNAFAVFELKYIPNKSEEDKSPESLYKDMDKKADEAIAQISTTLQDKKYKNQANQVITAGLVIYDRDKVIVKFAGNKL
jgi:hypothetical protein